MKYTTQQIKDLISSDTLNKFYTGYDWIALTHEVRKEQHNECQICRENGKYRRARIVHHVKQLRKHPELAYSKTYTDENGKVHRQLLCLCFDCHEIVHGRDVYYSAKPKGFFNEEKW